MGINYIVINILLGVINFFLFMYSEGTLWIMALADAVLLALWYFAVPHKKFPITGKTHRFYLIATIIALVLVLLVLFINGGNLSSYVTAIVFIPLFPLLPMAIFALLMGQVVYPLLGIIMILHCLYSGLKAMDRTYLRTSLIGGSCICLCMVGCVYMYVNRDEVKYAGHGFNYMQGYSSTDFTDYHVYSDPGKLVKLDHIPEIYFENEADMPVMDGAEACYPVYAAIAKAIYKDIDKIELANLNNKDKYYYNGKIVTFSNTVNAFYRLVDGDIDMLFGARPSQSQIDFARENGVEYELTRIGSEAFVFFVEKDNPVDNITSEQMRAIYHGDITNWKEVGGKNQSIVAFQRPEGSGSQTMMLYFMGDVTLKEPKTYEMTNPMDGIVHRVANYNNEAGALGYTFRYFLEGLMEETGVKMLSIDGVYPTVENVKNGTYPLITGLYCVTRANEDDPNVRKVLDFLLSEDGQYIIETTGYAGN